jgi:RHS repeat-associated protein
VPNAFTSRLNGLGKRIGAAITLKVMPAQPKRSRAGAGDRVDLGTKVWYPESAAQGNWDNVDPEDVLNSLVNTLGGQAAGLSGGKATPGELSGSGGPLLGGITDFLDSHPESPDNEKEPRAYLNWLLLDEQFKYVPQGSGFIRVPGFDDNMQVLAQLDLPITKSGYLFVYLSNETEKRDVFFDNLTVQHYTGPLTEETQYYPFGLVQKGISSRAAGKVENKKRFNGIEQTTDLDLNQYDAFFRTMDPQVGRWWQLDPKPNKSESPYAAMSNNPVLYNDFLGDTTRYYSEQGTLLLTIGGKGYNNAMVVNNDHLGTIKDYAAKYQDALTKWGDKIPNAKEIEAWAGHMGTTYDIKSFEKFYNDNQIPAKMFGNDKVSDMKSFTFNGKPLKLKAEVYGDVVLNNGIVTMGTGKTTTGSANIGFFDDIPRAKNSVADIHLHPISENGRYFYKLKSGKTQSGTMLAGPSGADMGHAQYNDNGYRSVVVDAKSVYLYGAAGTPVIVIPRKQ